MLVHPSGEAVDGVQGEEDEEGEEEGKDCCWRGQWSSCSCPHHGALCVGLCVGWGGRCCGEMGAVEEGVVQQQYKPYADAPIGLRPNFRCGKLVRGGLVVRGGGLRLWWSNPVFSERRDEASCLLAKSTRG